MKISNHTLTREFADFKSTNKKSGSFKEGLPDSIVIHYTAGGNLEGAVRTFQDDSVKASAHVLIDKNGSIVQMAPFTEITWHAGPSAWLDRRSLNNYAIGIEIVNAGRLEKNGAGYRSWFGRTYSDEDVVEAIHRNETKPTFWERFTEEQIEATYTLCKSLAAIYSIRHILGHEEISPGRKIDPGPAFPLDKLRDKIFHADRSDVETGEITPVANGIVNTGALNIHSGPSVQNRVIAPPLNRNTEVKILSETNGWYQVEVPLRGWVSKDFIKPGE